MREIRIQILGDSGVGKTSLIKTWINNSARQKEEAPEKVVDSEIDPKLKELFEKSTPSGYGCVDDGVMVMLEDGTRNERLLFSKCSSFLPPQAFILMYDVTQKKTTKNIEEWIKKIWNRWNEKMPIAIVGHKCDEDAKRKVKNEDGQKLAEDHGAMFFETSINDEMSIEDLIIAVKGIILS